MNDTIEDFLDNDNIRMAAMFIAGALFGAVAGSAAALLTAPQSGKATRKLIMRRGAALRDQALDTVDEAREQARRAVTSARGETRRAGHKVQQKAQELQDRSQELLERVKS